VHKRIGLLGGMSPESTIEYYQYITHTYTERYGDHGYPEVLIYSVSFQPYVDWPTQDRWDLVGAGLREAAQKLEVAGADFVAIATNTMHIVQDEVREGITIPLLSLLDAVGDVISAQGLRTVGLLGTRFTMEQPFYRDALSERGISVLVPGPDGRELVNTVIYDELVRGEIRDESRASYLGIIDQLRAEGAEGVVLGCTEIPLLVTKEHTETPLFDTTLVHAEAILNFALDFSE
jgi:aspartate racemase